MVSKRNGRIKDQTVDKFLIPAGTIERMNELNYKTHQSGKEQGMALCLDKKSGRVVPGNESEGDEISIFVPETCKDRKNQAYIGSWHSHPKPSETAFSAMDLFSSCDKRSKIDCIGMNKQGEIVCFVKKNLNESCQHDAKALVEIENMYGELGEEYDGDIIPDAVIETVDKLVDKKFISKKIL
jgi:hypothetical protein